MKHRRTTARVVLPVALILALGGISGCKTSQLGAAAIVGNQRITVSEIQGTLDDVRKERAALGLPTELGPDAARAEVERRVLDLVYERAAAAFGVTITADDIQKAREADERSDEEIAQLAAQNNVSVDDLDSVYRRFAIERKLTDLLDKQFPGATEDKLNEEYSNRLVGIAREMNIRINPRYGSFDAITGQIKPVTPDFFQVP